MRLSTFNFKTAIAIALVSYALVFVSFELASRYLLPKISKIQRRVEAEKSAFLHSKKGSPPVVYFIGNSLFLEGVDFEQLREKTKVRMDAHRFVIENTNVIDWYYGVKNALEAGAQPDQIILTFGAIQLYVGAVRGDYFAYQLMGAKDSVDVALETGIDRTTWSSLLLSSASAWLGGRSEIRKVIISRLFPPYQNLMSLTVNRAIEFPPEAYEIAKLRMAKWKDLCDRYHVKCSWILYPGVNAKDPYEELTRASRDTGLGLLVPVEKLAYPSRMYSDGFHLNEEGRAKFTEALVERFR